MVDRSGRRRYKYLYHRCCGTCLKTLLENALNDDMILDAVMAYSPSELNKFWHIRENVDALVTVCNYDQHFDISLPINAIGEHIGKISENLAKIEGVTHIFPFGTAVSTSCCKSDRISP